MTELGGILSGMKVLTTAFKAEENAVMKQEVEAQGATFLATLRRDDAVDVLIANGVNSPKYTECRDRGVPIVTRDWLVKSLLAGERLDFAAFPVPPFLGLVISVSQYVGRDRELLGQKIQAHGGSFQNSMTAACTHLVCAEPVGDKYRQARQWVETKAHYIWIVGGAWVDDCIERGVRVREEAYPVGTPLPPRGSGREPFAPQTVADTAARKWDLNPYPEDVAYGLRAGGAATAASAAALVQRSVQDARARGALGPAREGREAGAGLRDRGAVAGPSGDGADAVMAEAEAEAGVAHVGPMVPGLLAEGPCPDSASEGEEANILENTVFCFVGFSLQRAGELLGKASRHGALCVPRPCPTVTHLVLGPGAAAKEVAEVRALHAANGGRMLVVTAEWLELCQVRNTLVDLFSPTDAPDPRFLVDLSRPTALTTATAQAPAQAPAPAAAPSMAHAMAHAAPAADPGPFTGLVIDTAPLAAACSDPQTVADAREMAVQGGGTLAEELPRLPPGAGRWLTGVAVVGDWAMSAEEQERARRKVYTVEGRTLAFRGLANVNWVLFCDSVHRYDPPDQCVAFQPRPFPLPVPGFASVHATTSGLNQEERLIACLLVRTLGGRFSKKMSAANTHLIANSAVGDKYAACRRFGVEPVRLSWLYEAAHKGRLPDPGLFRPQGHVAATPRDVPAPSPAAPSSLHSTPRPREVPESRLERAVRQSAAAAASRGAEKGDQPASRVKTQKGPDPSAVDAAPAPRPPVTATPAGSSINGISSSRAPPAPTAEAPPKRPRTDAVAVGTEATTAFMVEHMDRIADALQSGSPRGSPLAAAALPLSQADEGGRARAMAPPPPRRAARGGRAPRRAARAARAAAAEEDAPLDASQQVGYDTGGPRGRCGARGDFQGLREALGGARGQGDRGDAGPAPDQLRSMGLI